MNIFLHQKKFLLSLEKDLTLQIKHYVRVSTYQFINEIHRVAEHMLNLKLENLSEQRKLTYKRNKQQIQKIEKKKSEIEKESNQNYWEFKKEFWADELSEYVFTLSNQCE